MQKFCLILILIPMLVSASSESAPEKQLVVRGHAHLYGTHPKKAKDVCHPHDAQWLEAALGKKKDAQYNQLYH